MSPGALPRGRPRAALVAEVAAALAELPPGARVGVAASGGPDSTGMAVLVGEARTDLALHVLHVRHGLRDDEDDAAAARELAARLRTPFAERRVGVVGLGGGPEADARAARYAALGAMARRARLEAVLVGHTADDQAETVLLNLVRGAGLTGVAGMPAVRCAEGYAVLRPVLRLRRDDVRAAAVEAGMRTVDDPTNRDPDQRRRRARAEVIPVLARLSGGAGDPVAALSRLADLARADDDVLRDLTAHQVRVLVTRWGAVRLARHEDLTALALGLSRRLVRALLAEVGRTDHPAGAEAVEAALGLDEGEQVVAPGGVVVARSQGWLTVSPPDPDPLRQRRLPTTGGVVLPELEVELRLEDRHAAEAVVACLPPAGPGPRLASLPLDEPPRGWVVRAASPGETIRSGGRDRPLRAVLTDRGVPRAVRAYLPVVADAQGRVVWVPGVAVRDGEAGGSGALALVCARAGGRPLG